MSGVRSAAEDMAEFIAYRSGEYEDIDFAADWPRLLRLCRWAYRQGQPSALAARLFQQGRDVAEAVAA